MLWTFRLPTDNRDAGFLGKRWLPCTIGLKSRPQGQSWDLYVGVLFIWQTHPQSESQKDPGLNWVASYLSLGLKNTVSTEHLLTSQKHKINNFPQTEVSHKEVFSTACTRGWAEGGLVQIPHLLSQGTLLLPVCLCNIWAFYLRPSQPLAGFSIQILIWAWDTLLCISHYRLIN